MSHHFYVDGAPQCHPYEHTWTHTSETKEFTKDDFLDLLYGEKIALYY